MPDRKDAEFIAELRAAQRSNAPYHLRPGKRLVGFVLDDRDSLVAQCDKLYRLLTLAESAQTARAEALREAAEIAERFLSTGQLEPHLPANVNWAAIVDKTAELIASAILAHIQEKNGD